MMIRCNAAISDEQIKYLQQFKLRADQFDFKQEGYSELIMLDWEDLNVKPADQEQGLQEGEGTGPVDMTQ